MDWKKPTVQMLGRWQPWHEGHQKLFDECLKITGQVCIMVRDVGGVVGDAGANRTDTRQDDNPFSFHLVQRAIRSSLIAHGVGNDQFDIVLVPNIVDISFGRGVGYTFTEHDLGMATHSISATRIREDMRRSGQLSNHRVKFAVDQTPGYIESDEEVLAKALKQIDEDTNTDD
jgi:hypothetical protein